MKLTVWCSFLGAWTLVAGAIFQAVLELREQDTLRDEVTKVLLEQEAPPPSSAWWWLLPPIGYLMERRRWKDRQRAMMGALNESQRDELVLYKNKTAGWSVVSLGGVLLAIAETWQVRRSYGGADWVFIVLLAAAATCCFMFPVWWLGRSDRDAG